MQGASPGTGDTWEIPQGSPHAPPRALHAEPEPSMLKHSHHNTTSVLFSVYIAVLLK